MKLENRFFHKLSEFVNKSMTPDPLGAFGGTEMSPSLEIVQPGPILKACFRTSSRDKTRKSIFSQALRLAPSASVAVLGGISAKFDEAKMKTKMKTKMKRGGGKRDG